MPGMAPEEEISSETVCFVLVVCLIVSSYSITPPIQFFILSDEKSVSLNKSLFSEDDETIYTLKSFSHGPSAFISSKDTFTI